MEIRKLEKAEHNLTRELYEEVFPEDSKGFVDYYYSEKTRDNQIYVIEEDGGIQAMLHLNPYHIMVNGIEKEVNYIVAVATRKPYRGRGFMNLLLRRAIKDMYLDGQSFTFLMPAAEAIYTSYDFRTVYEQERKRCPVKEAVTIIEKGEELSVMPVEQEDCMALAAAANQSLAAGYQVYALRDQAYYSRLIREYESDGGRLMVYRDGEKIRDCRPYVPEEGEIGIPKIMVRLLDVRRMLMAVRVKSLMAVCFRIVDDLIEENNRCVVITGTEFSGIMLMDSKPENAEGTIPVASLASFLFGVKSIEELCEEEGVEMTERMREELKKVIPLSRIYLNEVV